MLLQPTDMQKTTTKLLRTSFNIKKVLWFKIVTPFQCIKQRQASACINIKLKIKSDILVYKDKTQKTNFQNYFKV